MSITLTINGTSYTQSGRRSANYLLDGHGWDLDGDYSLEWHEHTSGPQPKLAGPVPVSLSVGGTTVFSGDMIAATPTISENGRTWCYQAQGLKYRANWIPVTAIDGAGTIRFNTDITDIDNYAASFAGKSVGDIVSSVLASHSTVLTAAGITTDGTTASQLAALTLVPSEEVVVAGERLWQSLESVFQRYARNIRLTILPSGLVRAIDVTVGTTHTLVVGTDPIDPPLFSRNWTHSATRTVIRGKGLIYPAYVSVVKGTLTPAWNDTQEDAWVYTDFTEGGSAADDGTVVSVDSATQVTVSSAHVTRTWATNFWPDVQAWIFLSNTSGSGLTYTESRPITACSSLTGGGTATITLGFDLENSGVSAFDSYKIIGTNVPLSSTGLADVWRLYNVTDPGSLIANHLVQHFPVPVPFFSQNGQSAFLTNTPAGQVFQPNGSGPAYFQVLPATGQILFYRPVVEQTTTIANMIIGGDTVTTPTDVYCLLAYSRGALEEPYPPDSGGPVYSGTAYTAAGLARTQFVDVDSWQYAGNRTILAALAQMLQQSTRDTLMEGTVNYRGYYSTVQDPSGGHLLSFSTTDPGYPSTLTGDESLAIPVRAVSYRYLTEGGGLLYSTQMRCSTRQDPRTGESQYMHLSVLGAGQGMGAQLGGAFGAGGPTMDPGLLLGRASVDRMTAEGQERGLGTAPKSAEEGATGGMAGFGTGVMGTQSPGMVDTGDDTAQRDKYGRAKADKYSPQRTAKQSAEQRAAALGKTSGGLIQLGTGEGTGQDKIDADQQENMRRSAARKKTDEPLIKLDQDQGTGQDKIEADQRENVRLTEQRKKKNEPLIKLAKRKETPEPDDGT